MPSQCSLMYKNIRKSLVFWYFEEVWKANIGKLVKCPLWSCKLWCVVFKRLVLTLRTFSIFKNLNNKVAVKNPNYQQLKCDTEI